MKTLLNTILILLLTVSVGACAKTNDDLPDMGWMKYANSLDMRDKLYELFPPGTPRERIEKALIKKAGADYEGKLPNVFNQDFATNAYQYMYQKPVWLRLGHDGRHLITIFYDEEDRVRERIVAPPIENTTTEINHIAIRISGPTGL